MANEFVRNIQDANLTATKALPAAGASAATDSIDLGANFNPTGGAVEVEVSLPATPSLVDAKTITLTLQDSADNSSFTAIASLATIVATGASSAGAAAITRRYRLPSDVRRYLNCNADVLTAGGSNIAVSFTMKVLV